MPIFMVHVKTSELFGHIFTKLHVRSYSSIGMYTLPAIIAIVMQCFLVLHCEPSLFFYLSAKQTAALLSCKHYNILNAGLR